MKFNSKGFTLVEVMIVVAIVALLAAIAIPNLLRSRVTANDASAKATLKSIANALENYYAVNNQYPTDPNDLIGDTPPYLSKDYFTGTHSGFTFIDTLALYSYDVTAIPQSTNHGSGSYTVTTGGVLVEN